MIIAIDGPAGAGKGTIATYLAGHLGLAYLDTGLLYRALAYLVLQRGLDPTHTDAVIQLSHEITLDTIPSHDLLRHEDIADMASRVAVIQGVRDRLTHLQREFASSIRAPYKGAVLDGRDIGTVVCPNADIKLFVTAAPEIRLRRRLLESSIPQLKREISSLIHDRDQRDTQRIHSPLQPASDTHILDTTYLSIHEACVKALRVVMEGNEGRASF